jgi:DNA polymerase
MQLAPKTPLAESVSAAIDWWREAGLDADFRDAPLRWLAPDERETDAGALPAAAPPPAPGEASPAPARDDWPRDLADFRQWWLEAPWLDEQPQARRVPPRGVARAELMVLVPEPEADDGERLLAGAQGRLLSAMLAAMGIPEDCTYVASVLPRHTPHTDWGMAERRGLGDLARHHIALVAPRRLIAFGASILPLIGHDPANSAARYGEINHEGGTVPLLAARDLALLLERPRWKAAVWRNWLDWPAGSVAGNGLETETS